MDNEYIEGKKVVPVVAGNTRIFLSVPEWAASLFIFAMVLCYTGKFWWIFLIIQFLLTVIYVSFLSKLEENIISVLIKSAQIPNIIYGSFNKPMPLNKKEQNEFKIGKE